MFDFENCEVIGHELSFNAERLLNLEIIGHYEFNLKIMCIGLWSNNILMI